MRSFYFNSSLAALVTTTLLISSFLLEGVHSFVPSCRNRRKGAGAGTSNSDAALVDSSSAFSPRRRRQQETELSAGFFDDIRNFFDNFFEGNSNNNDGNNNDDEEDDEDDELAAGTCNVATIPVENIKPGGLRLFLMFYLMGMQNTPEAKTWRADQPSSEEYVIDYWFHDKTAILSISLQENKIEITRTGSSPSNEYMIQENVILQGVFDELHQCAFDESVDVPNRLLVLPKDSSDAIDKARELLAFG